jgi:hypothetical protein
MPLQDLGQGPVRDAVAVREAAAPQDRRRRVGRLRPPEELRGQAGLPDPGIAVHRDEVRAPLPDDPLEDAPEEVELGGATDHRRGQSWDASRSDARLLHQTNGPHPIALALQLVEPSILEGEAADGVRGPLGDEDRSRVGDPLEPRRRVHRVARHHRLARPGVRRGEDLAGVDPDADLQRDVVHALEVAVQLVESPHHPKGCAERALGIVLVRRRHAERRHHRITDELLDRAALCLDLLAHRVPVGLHDLPEPLRVQSFAERGGPGDVGEQHRHDLPFLAGGRQRGG